MRINGQWFPCADIVTRPVVRGEILAPDGAWVEVPLLVDSGADRTVFSQNILASVSLESQDPTYRLAGVGGEAESIVFKTQLRLTSEEGAKITFRGQFAAIKDPEALDMSVLGRDITNLFALIVDKPSDVVCLLGQDHSYSIAKK